jgi:AcrR family transcriptional regulator
VSRRAGDVRLDDLLRTACGVIAERGLANTRTSDVAAAAGVSQALLFYHFETKERLLAGAFAWAAEKDLQRLDAISRSDASPLDKLRRILRWYAPSGSAKLWPMWIECWAEALRVPELERVSRRLDLRSKDALSGVIKAGATEGDFACPDPTGAAWRIIALLDGLGVAATVHPRVISRRQLSEWVRLGAARELGLEPDSLR